MWTQNKSTGQVTCESEGQGSPQGWARVQIRARSSTPSQRMPWETCLGRDNSRVPWLTPKATASQASTALVTCGPNDKRAGYQ